MGLEPLRADFELELSGLRSAVLDSSILIYHLEDCQPYSELTEALILRAGLGLLKCIISTISITELLVKPYSEGNAGKIAQFKNFIRMLPNTTIAAPDEDTADYAAYLRGCCGLRTPDALLIAAARRSKADAFVTNDRQLRKIEKEGVRILLIDDFIAQEQA